MAKVSLNKQEAESLAGMLSSNDNETLEFGLFLLNNNYNLHISSIYVYEMIMNALYENYEKRFRYQSYFFLNNNKPVANLITLDMIRDIKMHFVRKLVKTIRDTRNHKKLKTLHNEAIKKLEELKKENKTKNEYDNNLFKY